MARRGTSHTSDLDIRSPDMDREWEFCPGCQERKPLASWLGTELPRDPNDPLVCKDCRDMGVPRPDPFEFLEPRDRKLIHTVLRHGTIEGAAEELGMPRQTVSAIVRGRNKPHVRRAFQLLLEAHGLGFGAMAQMMRQLLYSKRAQWNPEDKQWDYFPDNSTRLGTLRHLTRIHEMEPPVEKNEKDNRVAVFVSTNLGTRTGPIEPQGTLIAQPARASLTAPKTRGGHIRRKRKTKAQRQESSRRRVTIDVTPIKEESE